MISKKKFLLLTIILNFFFNQSYASQNVNVGYIDIDRIIRESAVGKQILVDLDESKKKKFRNF